jgi:hypothetical protein
MRPKSFGCKTPIIEGFLTLDNAKYWYLNLIYGFFYKCLDMERMHFVNGDTDSMTWAIAGSMDEPYNQSFKHVIKNEDFYNSHVYNWFPNSFYSTNNSGKTFATKLEKEKDKKKLLGLCIEKECDGMLAEAAKVYTPLFISKSGKWFSSQSDMRNKGVVMRQNKLFVRDYYNTLLRRTVQQGSNTNLQMHNGVMSKITVRKNILTAAHTKYRVSEDFSTCTPLFL